jgi:hypothetical protein
LLVGSVLALVIAGAAAASDGDERGIDPNQGESLVEVTLPSKAAAVRLQLEADSYGVDFNDEYLGHNRDGSVTASVFGTEDEIAALEAAGFDVSATLESPATWETRLAARQAAIEAN